MYCQHADCEREAKRNGLCWTHVKRRQRGSAGGPNGNRYPSRWERVAAAILAYTEAEDDTAFARAKKRAERAIEAWFRGRKA